MTVSAYGLPPDAMLRSVAASRSTLSREQTRLIDVVARVDTLSGGAPAVVIGGLAQILEESRTWAEQLERAEHLRRAIARAESFALD